MVSDIKNASDKTNIQELLLRFHSSENVTLWTIQHSEAWETAKKTGILRADGRRAISGFQRQYRWMISQAKQRIPGYSGRHPIWAWFHPKPDLRRSGHKTSGTRAVRIEFDVPIYRVLLSEFEAWHTPLNNGYLGKNEEEDEAFDRLSPSLGTRLDQFPFHLQQRVEASWEHIFDIEEIAESGYTGGGERIQAIIEEIRLEEVTRVTPFTAR